MLCVAHFARLQLGEGEVSTSTQFEAPGGATYDYTVDTRMPIGTNIQVSFQTARNDLVFALDTGTDAPDYENCETDGTDRVCSSGPFGLGEVYTAGIWTAHIVKLSTPSADVALTIEWTPTGIASP